MRLNKCRETFHAELNLSKTVRFNSVFGVSGRSENSPSVDKGAATNEVVGASKKVSLSQIDNAKYERVRKVVSRHANPSWIKKNRCVV